MIFPGKWCLSSESATGLPTQFVSTIHIYDLAAAIDCMHNEMIACRRVRMEWHAIGMNPAHAYRGVEGVGDGSLCGECMDGG